MTDTKRVHFYLPRAEVPAERVLCGRLEVGLTYAAEDTRTVTCEACRALLHARDETPDGAGDSWS